MTTFENVPLTACSFATEDTDPGETQLRFNIPYTGPIRAGHITATITIKEEKE